MACEPNVSHLAKMDIFTIHEVWTPIFTREYFLTLCFREFILTYANLWNVKHLLPPVGTNMVGERSNDNGWSDIMEKVDMLRIHLCGQGMVQFLK